MGVGITKELMSTEAIIIQVDTEAARAFNAASVDEQKKLQALLNVWLKQLAAADAAPLKGTMDDIGARAQARGLTPEILDALLDAE